MSKVGRFGSWRFPMAKKEFASGSFEIEQKAYDAFLFFA